MFIFDVSVFIPIIYIRVEESPHLWRSIVIMCYLFEFKIFYLTFY